MFYRENGQYKTSYRADQQIFPISQDRIAIALILAFAFLAVPMLASDYLFRAILIPFLIFSLAAIGVNILVGYCGQISLGTGGFMAVGAYAAYNFQVRIDGMPVIVSMLLGGVCATAIGVLFGILEAAAHLVERDDAPRPVSEEVAHRLDLLFPMQPRQLHHRDGAGQLGELHARLGPAAVQARSTALAGWFADELHTRLRDRTVAHAFVDPNTAHARSVRLTNFHGLNDPMQPLAELDKPARHQVLQVAAEEIIKAAHRNTVVTAAQ